MEHCIVLTVLFHIKDYFSVLVEENAALLCGKAGYNFF